MYSYAVTFQDGDSQYCSTRMKPISQLLKLHDFSVSAIVFLQINILSFLVGFSLEVTFINGQSENMLTN